MDEKKKSTHRCPECGSSVIWNHSNSKAGSTSITKCGNNPASSRIDWNPKTGKFCFWEGVAKRKRNGEIELFHKDGISMLRSTHR